MKKLRHRFKFWIFQLAQQMALLADWIEHFSRPCERHRWREGSGGTHSASYRCFICGTEERRNFNPPREMPR